MTLTLNLHDNIFLGVVLAISGIKILKGVYLIVVFFFSMRYMTS